MATEFLTGKTMKKTPAFTKAEIVRAIKATQEAGLTVFEVAATKQGVRILTSEPADRVAGGPLNPWDGLVLNASTQ